MKRRVTKKAINRFIRLSKKRNKLHIKMDRAMSGLNDYMKDDKLYEIIPVNTGISQLMQAVIDTQRVINRSLVLNDFKESEKIRIERTNKYMKGDTWSQVEGEDESKAFPLTADDEQRVNRATKSIIGKSKSDE